ncbi:MAG TPA: ABC transporter ATP-binding protein [Acidimicrobiales bacterium]
MTDEATTPRPKRRSKRTATAKRKAEAESTVSATTTSPVAVDRGGDPVLSVRDLTSGYGSLPVLHGISFDVHEGEIVVILGLNGAGKSTTVQNLCGVIQPWSGSITYKGEDSTGWNTVTYVEKGVTLVPEGRRIFPDLSVEKNLLVGSWTQRQDPTWFQSQRETVFDFLPRLRERRNQLAGTLSGGEQQMLAIGRGLMANPDLLIIDEASMGLAPVIVKEIFKIVAGVRDSGRTVILVEQNIGALEIADLGVVVGKGVVDAEIRGDELSDPVRLRELYMG